MNIKYLENESLSKFCTFGIGGKADKIFLPNSKEELFEIYNNLDPEKDKPIIIGGGSNILFSSQGYRGTIIITTNLKNVYLEDNETIVAESGLRSPALATFCLNNDLSGLEFLAGIPGTAGGAVFMNCSANGQSISQALLDAEVFNTQTKKINYLTSQELGLEYRKSRIDPRNQIVLSARFKLKKAEQFIIKEKMDFNLNFRKSKQPRGKNAGSIFKNPGNKSATSAGYLLDTAGAKGWCEGRAEVSIQHANFINNIDNATSLDVSRLMLRMHNEVKEKFNYNLYPEIKYIGEPTEEEVRIWKILTVQ